MFSVRSDEWGKPTEKKPVCVLDKSFFFFPKSKKLGKTIYM